MSSEAFKTVLVGFGKISSGYAKDSQMNASMQYSTHAQVLRDHPDFAFDAVVDPKEEACFDAKSNWGITNVAPSLSLLQDREKFEVAVIATPPEHRLEILQLLPNLKAIVLEKPIADNFESAKRFVDELKNRRIISQVNLLRRADRVTRELANGALNDRIGRIQFVNGFYGNGLINNATHMIDLLRMFMGEIDRVQCLGATNAFKQSPINSDSNFAFALITKSGITAVFQPLQFDKFRENGLDIWGERGRIEYLHGGLTILKTTLRPNCMLQNAFELDVLNRQRCESSLGTAIYEVYTNLSMAIKEKAELYSSCDSALMTARVVQGLFQSFENSNQLIEI